jgi:hypothetical protein
LGLGSCANDWRNKVQLTIGKKLSLKERFISGNSINVKRSFGVRAWSGVGNKMIITERRDEKFIDWLSKHKYHFLKFKKVF